MKFIDTAKIKISSGKGGNGIIAWRREKYEPRGGPAGGSGGKGGSVYLEACSELSTLLDFRFKSIFKAEDGGKGGTARKTGRSGNDLIIKVPCGTIVKNAQNEEIIADLVLNGQRVLVAEGGRGGRGNSLFATSTRQSPHFCEPGEPEIERELELELKLIAQVGIIGLPNAGKSTLISVISSARPKIADYPFTTLVPNLGVVKKPSGDGLVIADIPGLIKGASDGLGLGHEFMRHVERTKLLVHIIDSSELGGNDPLDAYEIIQGELKSYDEKLYEKKQLLVLNKIDLIKDEEKDILEKKFKEKGLNPIFISAVTKKNTDQLLNVIFRELESIPNEEIEIQTYYDPFATDHKFDEYNVYKEGKVFYIEGKKISALMQVANLRDFQSVGHLMKILKAMGVFNTLQEMGAKDGDPVVMGGISFEYGLDTMVIV